MSELNTYMTWLFDPTSDPSLYESIVYLITNKKTGQMYVGKKALWQRRKGKTDQPSDWATYWGSSEYLLADISLLGEDQFTRQVLHWCFTRGDASYFEAKELFARDVLDSTLPNGLHAYYNRNILSMFFFAPGRQQAKPKLKTVKKYARLTKILKQQVLTTKGTQKALSEQFNLPLKVISEIKKEIK